MDDLMTMVSVLCIVVILLYITSLIGGNVKIMGDDCYRNEFPDPLAPNLTCFKEFQMENQGKLTQNLGPFSPDVTSDLYPWTLLRALLTEVGTTERSGKPCIPAAVSKFSNPKKPDLLVEEPERHRKSEKEEVLPMASLEPEMPRPKTVSGKQEVVLPKQLNEIHAQSQKVPKHLESVPQQSEPIPQNKPKPVLIKKKTLPKECLLNGTAVVPIEFCRRLGYTLITDKTWKFIGQPKLIKTKVRLYYESGDRMAIKGIIKVHVVDVVNDEKGIIPIYVGEEGALKTPLLIGTSGQPIEDFKLNSLFIDEKTEECLTKKGPLHWMKSKIGRKKLPIPIGKGEAP